MSNIHSVLIWYSYIVIWLTILVLCRNSQIYDTVSLTIFSRLCVKYPQLINLFNGVCILLTILSAIPSILTLCNHHSTLYTNLAFIDSTCEIIQYLSFCVQSISLRKIFSSPQNKEVWMSNDLVCPELPKQNPVTCSPELE